MTTPAEDPPQHAASCPAAPLWACDLGPEERGPDAGRVGLSLLVVALSAVPVAYACGLLDGIDPAPGSPLGFAMAVPAPLLAAGLAAIGLVQRHRGRDELRLDAGAIRVVRRLGRLSWSWTVPRDRVAEFVVVRKPWYPSGDQPAFYHVLAAEDDRGRRRVLAASYPRERLLALAAALSAHWKAPAHDPDFDPARGAAKIAVAEDSDIPTEIVDRTTPPRGTRLVLESAGAGAIRITRPSSGPGTIAAAIALIILVPLAAFVLWPGGGPADPPLVRGFMRAGLLAFLLLPIGLSLLALGRMRSRHVLAADPAAGLTRETIGLLGPTRTTWPAGTISSIRAEAVPGRGDDAGKTIDFRVVVRTADPAAPGPRFDIAEAGAGALVQLLRKPEGAPASAYVVVGSRTGPGPIADRGPIAEGPVDYAARTKTADAGLGRPGPLLAMTILPPEDELVAGLSKPETEWVAAILRRALGVPAADPE